jgi:hypothetical protein
MTWSSCNRKTKPITTMCIKKTTENSCVEELGRSFHCQKLSNIRTIANKAKELKSTHKHVNRKE